VISKIYYYSFFQKDCHPHKNTHKQTQKISPFPLSFIFSILVFFSSLLEVLLFSKKLFKEIHAQPYKVTLRSFFGVVVLKFNDYYQQNN